jgi:hypothetical protein
MTHLFRLCGLVALVLGVAACAAAGAELDKIKLPPGFHIEVYAEVPGARSMAVAEPLGAVFVGTRGGRVFAVLDRDGDRKADEVVTVEPMPYEFISENAIGAAEKWGVKSVSLLAVKPNSMSA